jgi:hypothetical protein
MTGRVTARWEDIVTFAHARLLEWQGCGNEAGTTYRELITSALAGGRLMHAVLGSCGLADVLTLEGAHAEADDVLRRAAALLVVGADLRQHARLQVRRARLLRLRGDATGAAAALASAVPAFAEDELPPERIVWFVETALLRAESEPLAALAELSARTGVQVPPWEQQWTAIGDGARPGR